MISYSYTDSTSLSDAIEKTVYPGGGTNTADALSSLVTTVFTPSHGDRPDVQNTAIVITDGEPTINKVNLPKAIDDVRNNGINVIVVGITENVKTRTLKQISSPPHQVICETSVSKIQYLYRCNMTLL